MSIEERVAGSGASWVMAPFTHIGWPSRFSDGTWGVYYCARSLPTAVCEKAYHVGRFLAATEEPLGTTTELRALVGTIDASFHDVRGGFRAVHARDDYRASQVLGRELRKLGSNGVAYDSVRHRGGACLGAFRPKAVKLPVSGPNLRFHFDGARVDRWFHFGDKVWRKL